MVHHDVEPVDESTLGPGARQTQQGAVEGRCGQLQLDAMTGEVRMQEFQQDQHVRLEGLCRMVRANCVEVLDHTGVDQHDARAPRIGLQEEQPGPQRGFNLLQR